MKVVRIVPFSLLLLLSGHTHNAAVLLPAVEVGRQSHPADRQDFFDNGDSEGLVVGAPAQNLLDPSGSVHERESREHMLIM